MGKSKPRILSVRIERAVDDSPDTSYLGEYSNTAETEWAIDRQERGDQGRNEHRYFNPTMSPEDTGNPDSPEQDYQRMESLNRGDWCCLGIIAKAEVVLTGGVVQTLHSGGLWGTESDSGEDYLLSIEKEELANLRTELEAVGFGKRAIDYAFRSVKRED